MADSTALDGARIRKLRELKGFGSQRDFADRIQTAQPHISDLENGKLRNATVLLRVADELDSTTDFLFRRGPYKDADDPDAVRDAAVRMSFDVFVARIDVAPLLKTRCARVIGHPHAPVTAREWKWLSEMIERALDPEPVRARIAGA